MSFLGGMSASRLFLNPEVRTYTGWSLLLMADPGPLRGSPPLQLRLVQGGNPLFVGGIEPGIGRW